MHIQAAQILPGDTVALTADAYQGTVYQTSIAQPRLQLADWLEHVKDGDFVKGRLKLVPGTEAVPFPFASRLVVEHYTGV